MWKTLVFFLIGGVVMAGPMVHADEWNSSEMKQYYEAQVAWEIDHCLQKCHLMNSRSPALREKARQEVGKAHYLKMHKTELVKEMMAADLGPHHYKVQQYINHSYRDRSLGYATVNLRYCK